MNTKISKALLSLTAALALLASSVPSPITAFAKSVYYVSSGGSDDNSGSSNAPFKTINKAVQAMSSGDICYIKGGTYRESVMIDGKSRLTFAAYSTKDKPLISGSDSVTDWTNESGNIWYADCPEAFIESDYNRVLVFSEGELADEARWPNTADGIIGDDKAHPLLQRSTYATVASVQAQDKVTLSDLPDADITDGYIWLASNPSYWSYNLNILSKNGNQITFTNPSATAKAGDLCYIYGSKSLMDAEGEWYLDKESKRLYFYTENSQGPQNVEIRSREYALKVTNSRGISFDGINFRGASVQLGEGSTGCEIKNALLETLDKKYPTASDRTYHRANADGVLIGGEGNTLCGCEIKNMYGRGVSVEGNENSIINNYVHDVNFEHNNYDDGIRITEGAGHSVCRNTVTRTGRSAIGAYCTGSVIAYNYLYDGNRLSKDSGLMYFNDKNYENTEVHHNIMGESLNNTGMQYGLYLDSFSSGMLIYNNLIYGQESGSNASARTSVIGPNTIGNLFANNTYVNTKTINGLKGDRSGTAFVNNLFVNEWKDTTWDWSVIYESNNVIADESVLNDDYTLSDAAVSAIDSGMYLSGINDGYTGTAPDCGAYEYGAPKWTAGCDFSNPNRIYERSTVNLRLPLRNSIVNPSFESEENGGMNGWSGSDAEIFKQSTWNYFGSLTKSGKKGVKIDSGAKITQTVTGLKPNTVYEAGGYGAVAGPFYAAWKSGGSSPQLTVYDQATGFADGRDEYISYSTFKLDAGYDTIVFGFQQTAGRGKTDKSITLKSGSADGDVLINCEISGSGTYNDNGYMWDWVSASIPESLRGRTLENVCLVFKGDGFKTYGGYYLYDSQSDEKITISATSGANSNSVEITDSLMPSVRPSMEITTDSVGAVTIEVMKSEGIMYGYADDLFLREKLVSSSPTDAQCDVSGLKITDVDENLMYGIRFGDKHIISGKVKNKTSSDKTATVTLRSYTADGSEYGRAESKIDVSAASSSGFKLSLYAHTGDGAYFTLTVSDNAGSTVYTINDELLEGQLDTDTGIYLKTVTIYDQDGEILTSVTPGIFNMFFVTVNNSTENEDNMQGILAVYDENDRLVKTASFKRKMASGVNQFGFGTVIPSGGNAYAKLFTWSDLNSIKPITEAAVFK